MTISISHRFLGLNDLPECHALMVEQERVYDEYLAMEILPRDTPTLDEFTNEMKENKYIRGVVLEELTPFQERYSSKTELVRVIVGFTTYKMLLTAGVVEIIHLYAVKGREDIYKQLIEVLLDKLKKSKELNKLAIEIPETKERLLKIFGKYRPNIKLISRNGKDYYREEISK